MPLTNQSAITLAVPTNRTDQIIGIRTGTFVCPDPGLFGDNYTEDTFSHGFNDTCLTRLRYSVDGGASWQDDSLGAFSFNDPILEVLSFSTNTTAGVRAHNVSGTATSQAYTVQYQLYLIAKRDQTYVEPIPTSQVLAYSSGLIFRKIFMEDVISVSLPSSVSPTTTTINHNLGYIPDTMTWIEVTSGTFAGRIFPITPRTDYSIAGTTGNVTLTETQMKIAVSSIPATNIKIHYRIYL